MQHYAFKGEKVIAGPFKTRLEAKEKGKPGYKCRFCGKYSGGNTVCYACALDLLSKPGPKPTNEEIKRENELQEKLHGQVPYDQE